MSEIDDGGTAFPTEYNDRGLTMRDYFAAAALTGLVNNRELVGKESDKKLKGSAAYAAQAYILADAMLEARKEAQP